MGKLILLGISCKRHRVPLSLSKSLIHLLYFVLALMMQTALFLLIIFPSLTEQLFLGLFFLLVLSCRQGYNPLFFYPPKETVHSRLCFSFSPGSNRRSLPSQYTISLPILWPHKYFSQDSHLQALPLLPSKGRSLQTTKRMSSSPLCH